MVVRYHREAGEEAAPRHRTLETRLLSEPGLNRLALRDMGAISTAVSGARRQTVSVAYAAVVPALAGLLALSVPSEVSSRSEDVRPVVLDAYNRPATTLGAFEGLLGAGDVVRTFVSSPA